MADPSATTVPELLERNARGARDAPALLTPERVLLDHGADPNLPDPRGSPLHTIAWLRKPGSTGTAAVGGEADAPVRATGNVTSLELARQLLDAGANPNVRIDWEESRFNKLGGTARNPPGLTLGRHLLTYNGATAFYIAAKNGDTLLMRLLADGGAEAPTDNHRRPENTA